MNILILEQRMLEYLKNLLFPPGILLFLIIYKITQRLRHYIDLKSSKDVLYYCITELLILKFFYSMSFLLDTNKLIKQ